MTTRLTLLRPADLVHLELELHNLEVAGDGASLTRVDPAQDAVVVVHLPPQALAEETFTGQPPEPPVRTVMAGPTRLAFRLPVGDLPLTMDSLLDWTRWDALVAPTALPAGTPPSSAIPLPAPAGPTETSVEFPWRLTLSPDAGGRWHTAPSASGSVDKQLWSTVLATDPTAPHGLPAPPVDVRAVSARTGVDPFSTSVSSAARRDVVNLTSNFQLPVPADAGGAYTPVPLRARRLELTSLGAVVDLEGRWDYPLAAPDGAPPGFQPIDLRQYQHVAALGRDTFVRTVRVGWLCGTGHQAVVIETVQRMPAALRVVATPPEGAMFTGNGYLIRTTDVVVQQPRMDYAAPLDAAFAHSGKEFPFSSITLTTLNARVSSVPEGEPAWLLGPEGDKLLFHAVGIDQAGAAVHFALPLMFVPFSAVGAHQNIRSVFAAPPGVISDAHRIDLSGQPLAVAPPGDRPGSTVVTTATVEYDIEQPAGFNPNPDHAMRPEHAPTSYIPRFLPRLTALTGSFPAVDRLTGRSRTVRAELDRTYLSAGLHPVVNKAQLFLALTEDLSVSLPSQRGGGLASTSGAARGVSRTLGPVAAPDALRAEKVDLSAFSATRLLGTISLLDLLPDVLDFDAEAAGTEPDAATLDNPHSFVNPPRLVTRREPPGAAVPDVVESRFLWKPPLRTQKVFPFLTLDLDGADLLLDATTRVVTGGPADTVAVGRLRNVGLTFAGALSARIAQLTFRAESGRKVELGATDVEIGFLGPLAFVETLRSVLPADGFDDPPYLTADAQGVVAGYTLGIPELAVGIFSLQSISIGAALSIPFTDRPAGVRFAISERHKPFLVTVSLFGGGGFFAIGVSAAGIESVEAALEFGGDIALNLGVASGGVSVMAGIYFAMQGSSVTLTGYLRCGGHLEVLGLITLSLEFYLAFTYRDKDPGGSEVWGQASLTVGVKIAFFSTSVTLSVERRFAGSDGDPTFEETVGPEDWVRYLQAFA